MSSTNAQNANKLLTYTPSNYINNAIKQFANKATVEAKKVEGDAQPTRDTFGASVAKGLRKGVG